MFHIEFTQIQPAPPNLKAFLGPAKVWMSDFQHKLRIRHQGHHAKCSTCCRHRLIIRRLGRGPARVAQMKLYKDHLSRQYRDRQVYWGHRAKSRSQSTAGGEINHISCIIDAMDQAKHAYPKGEALSAKEFSSWVRPRLQATTLICHGHAILVGLSPQNTSPCGSRSMELVAHLLTKTVSQVHWPNVFLHLEADNCSKELKNQTSLRMLATMISLHRLRGCEFSYLSSGHSHEDIDAHFSLCASYLQRFPELHNIKDFQQCMEKMLENPSVRVHEPKREVVVFDSFHDWTSDEASNIFFRNWFPCSNKLGGNFIFGIGLHCSNNASSIQERALCPLPRLSACQRHRGARGPPCLSTGENPRLRT